MEKKNLRTISINVFVPLILGFLLGIVISIIIKINTNWSSYIAPLITLIVGVLFPLLNTYLINKPQLSIEISSINRQISDENKIFLNDYSEFSVLKEYYKGGKGKYNITMISNDGGYSKKNDNSIKLRELESIIDLAKQDLKDLPETIDKRKQEYDKIKSYPIETFNINTADKLNESLIQEVKWEDFNNEKSNIRDEFIQKYGERCASLEKRHLNLQNNLPSIERKFESIRKGLIENKSYFTISTTLVNSGRINTSIKRPALLRVYIGQGNYVDLKLVLKNFETMSEIGSQRTKVAIFESSEISALPEDDRKLINIYWGQSVNSILFAEDIYGNVHTSNTISFAEGLYQKLIYDKLAAIASSKLFN